MEITSTKEVVQTQGISLLIYGRAGAGKTTLCSTTGDLDRTLIISAEAGLLSLREYDIDVVQVRNLNDLRDAYQFLNSGSHDYRWVCVDSISEIGEVALSREKNKTKDNRQAYGEMAETMKRLIRNFRNLPMHVVMSAKETVDDDNGRQVHGPSAPGNQVKDELAYAFDEVFALTVRETQEGELERWLLTENTGRYECKDRSGALARWEEPDLANIKAKIEAVKGGSGASQNTDAQPEPAQSRDKQPQQSGDDVHWSAVKYTDRDPAENDQAYTHENKRFWGITEDIEDDLIERFRQMQRDRHGVESTKQIPPGTLQRWNDLLDKKSDDLSGFMSEKVDAHERTVFGDAAE